MNDGLAINRSDIQNPNIDHQDETFPDTQKVPASTNTIPTLQDAADALYAFDRSTGHQNNAKKYSLSNPNNTRRENRRELILRKTSNIIAAIAAGIGTTLAIGGVALLASHPIGWGLLIGVCALVTLGAAISAHHHGESISNILVHILFGAAAGSAAGSIVNASLALAATSAPFFQYVMALMTPGLFFGGGIGFSVLAGIIIDNKKDDQKTNVPNLKWLYQKQSSIERPFISESDTTEQIPLRPINKNQKYYAVFAQALRELTNTDSQEFTNTDLQKVENTEYDSLSNNYDKKLYYTIELLMNAYFNEDESKVDEKNIEIALFISELYRRLCNNRKYENPLAKLEEKLNGFNSKVRDYCSNL